MKSACLLAALPLLVALFGCSSEPTAPDDPPARLMPLAVGNVWIDRTTNYDSAGNVRSTTYDTVTIQRMRTIAGEAWFETYDGVWVANRREGYWVSLEGGSAWLAAKFPATVGDTFGSTMVQLPGPGGSERFLLRVARVAAVDTSVTVPAGAFRSYEYRYSMTELDGSPIADPSIFYDDRYFAAPGVGWIRNELYDRTTSGTIFLLSLRELIHYRLQ